MLFFLWSFVSFFISDDLPLFLCFLCIRSAFPAFYFFLFSSYLFLPQIWIDSHARGPFSPSDPINSHGRLHEFSRNHTNRPWRLLLGLHHHRRQHLCSTPATLQVPSLSLRRDLRRCGARHGRASTGSPWRSSRGLAVEVMRGTAWRRLACVQHSDNNDNSTATKKMHTLQEGGATLQSSCKMINSKLLVRKLLIRKYYNINKLSICIKISPYSLRPLKFILKYSTFYMVLMSSFDKNC